MNFIKNAKKITKILQYLEENKNGFLFIEEGEVKLKEVNSIERKNMLRPIVQEVIIKREILYLINEYHYKFRSWDNIKENKFFYYIKFIYYILWVITILLAINFIFYQTVSWVFLLITFLLNFCIYVVISKESNKLLIESFKKIDSNCENFLDAERLWLEKNFGCRSNFINQIEILEKFQKIYNTHKGGIDLRPSIFKLSKSKALVPIISATVSLVTTFILKMDFTLATETLFDINNLNSLARIFPLFIFIATYIYILIYGFLFIVKIVIQCIIVIINNLDGYKSRSQIRVDQLIMALQKNAIINLKND